MSRISLLLFGSGLLLNTAFGFAAAIAPVPFPVKDPRSGPRYGCTPSDHPSVAAGVLRHS